MICLCSLSQTSYTVLDLFLAWDLCVRDELIDFESGQ
jgi:hypothetical protein